MKRVLLLFLLCSAFTQAISNNESSIHVQNVRGQVTDQQSQVPLYGAAVEIFAGDFSKGTITDEKGYFVIEDIPVGRVTVLVSHLSYFPRRFSNIQLTTGIELVLEVEMEEQVKPQMK
jgi:hypothetical protein